MEVDGGEIANHDLEMVVECDPVPGHLCEGRSRRTTRVLCDEVVAEEGSGECPRKGVVLGAAVRMTEEQEGISSCAAWCGGIVVAGQTPVLGSGGPCLNLGRAEGTDAVAAGENKEQRQKRITAKSTRN